MAFRREKVPAFNVQDFEVRTDIDGYLVMRPTHSEKGERHQKTYALDFEQDLRFISAFRPRNSGTVPTKDNDSTSRSFQPI